MKRFSHPAWRVKVYTRNQNTEKWQDTILKISPSSLSVIAIDTNDSRRPSYWTASSNPSSPPRLSDAYHHRNYKYEQYDKLNWELIIGRLEENYTRLHNFKLVIDEYLSGRRGFRYIEITFGYSSYAKHFDQELQNDNRSTSFVQNDRISFGFIFWLNVKHSKSKMRTC
jgi:hypothetical protein